MSAISAIVRPGRRSLRRLVWTGGAAVVVLLALRLLPLLPATEYRGTWQTPGPVILLGIIQGITYGLLGVGLVLIFRTNRFINFAHGEMGGFGAAFFSLSVVKWHFPYWVAFFVALLVTASVGAIVETAVVRRLRNVPRIMSVVATLGAGQFLVTLGAVVNNEARAGASFPEPVGLPTFDVGPLFVDSAYSGMLILGPVVVLALAVFLKRSRYGLAILGSAANPEAARMAGIFAGRMSGLAWAIAGALSAFTAILIQPTQGFSGQSFFGPNLLLRALTCAVIARMTSLPIALMAGIGLGIVEQLVFWNYADGTLMSVVLFVTILVALLAQRSLGGREEDKGSWAAVQALRPIPQAFKQMWIARNLGRVTAGVSFALAIVVPLFLPNSGATTLAGMIAFAIVGFSVGIATGLGGQLTLGQFALAAMGGLVSVIVAERTGNFLLSFVYAGVAGALASLVIGLPALRVKGLMLTVTTLSFALLVPIWLLGQSWMLGDPPTRIVPTVEVWGNPLVTGRSYYFFAVGVLVVVMWLVRNVWRGGFGRLLRAIRDNEDAARSFTIPVTSSKTKAFLFSGLVAGVGGALYAHGLTVLNPSTFPVTVSIAVVTMTVVGGISLMAGPLLGVLLVIGLPNLALTDSLLLAGTQLGILLLILYLPGGLGSLIEPIRDRILGYFATRRGISPGIDEEAVDNRGSIAVTHRDVAVQPMLPASRRVGGEILLEAADLHKTFGGVHAVDGVSLTVRAGEILGMIGPNGAGKTTTFELLGGFTRPDSGAVYYDGREITWWKPEARARIGMIRSFQDAALFPTLNVVEVVQLALERVAPTRVVPSALGLHGGDRAKEDRARQIISFMGLDKFAHKQVRELSTGTRRITELACMVALEPALLLLDEPSSGIAQRETEELGRLLVDLKARFGMTLLIIEHDIPLIMGLSDRIVAMADGRIIAEGTPEVVREDPLVIEAYLGGSVAAIERSGVRTDHPAVVPAT